VFIQLHGLDRQLWTIERGDGAQPVDPYPFTLGLFGLLFLRKAKGDERWVMPFLCAIQAYLFILLTAMSPFKLHPLEGDLLTAMQQQGIPIPHGGWERLVYLLGLAPVIALADDRAGGVEGHLPGDVHGRAAAGRDHVAVAGWL